MQELVTDIGQAIRTVDESGLPFKAFKPGAGPYGEPQLVKLIKEQLATRFNGRYNGIQTCRVPDVLVPGRWALEFKIVRPFGDNGVEAEHWSQNLLHPYPGNVSAIGDLLKLTNLVGTERKGVIVICWEHLNPKIDLSRLVDAFELLARDLLKLPLGNRHTYVVGGCIHPVHQTAVVNGWELDAPA